MFSKQEVFNQVVAGLAGQDYKRSLHPPTVCCVFRGNDGLKCAVGHILPDEIVPQIELNDFSPFLNQIPGFSYEEHYDLLDDLMDAHDTGRTPETMKENLRDVAYLFELDSTNVQ